MQKNVFFDREVMGDFLKKHDMIYEKPATVWEDGMPLGNSILGAVIWGDDGLNISLDRADIWEQRRYEPDRKEYTWKKFCEFLEEGNVTDFGIFGQKDPGPTIQRVPVGRMRVSFKGKIMKSMKMRLTLYDALASGEIVTELGSIYWTCYLSAGNPHVIFHYDTDGKEEVSISFKYITREGDYLEEMRRAVEVNPFRGLREFLHVKGYPEGLPEFAKILHDWGWPEAEESFDDRIKYFMQKIPEDGDFAVGQTDFQHADGSHTIIVGIEHDMGGQSKKKVREDICSLFSEHALETDFQEHKKKWNSFYPQSFLSFSDTKLEGLYWIQIYKLGCVASPDGIVPTASGPWSKDDGLPLFNANAFFWNQQQQGILIPAFTANRLQLCDTTFEELYRSRPEMKRFCNDFFETDGEFLPHMTGPGCRALHLNPDHFEYLSGPWICQFMWMYYRYSLDEEFLRERLYPMMKEQIKPIIHNLERMEDGKLHLKWTMSAEYQGEQETYRWSLGMPTDWSIRFGPDATSDLAFLRFMCEALLQSSEILEIEEENQSVWKNVLENLAEPALDRFGGLKVRRDLELESSHRHLSHLFAIDYLHQYDYDDSEQKKIIDQSLYVIKLRGSSEWMGWTFCEMAKLFILAKQPARARMLLMNYADQVVRENTFDTEGTAHDCGMTTHGAYGLTIEDSGMYASAVQDFAVRSFLDKIYVLDVVPEAWPDVSFYHLRAEGAFLISAARKNGHTEFISILSEKGGPVRLISELGADAAVTCDGAAINAVYRDGEWQFDTEVGKEYLLCERDDREVTYCIEPVSGRSFEENYFGIKKRSRF